MSLDIFFYKVNHRMMSSHLQKFTISWYRLGHGSQARYNKSGCRAKKTQKNTRVEGLSCQEYVKWVMSWNAALKMSGWVCHSAVNLVSRQKNPGIVAPTREKIARRAGRFNKNQNKCKCFSGRRCVTASAQGCCRFLMLVRVKNKG